jgi:hypothetical protein
VEVALEGRAGQGEAGVEVAGFPFAVLIIPFSDVLPMYLLYLCKIQVSGFHRWCPRSLPSYGSLSLLIAAVLPWVLPTHICCCCSSLFWGEQRRAGQGEAGVEVALEGRAGQGEAGVEVIPFSDVLPMYLLYLCKIQVSGFHRWCPRSLPSYGSLSLLIAAAVDLYFTQVQKVHG